MRALFRSLAAYNRWANRRLYAAAAALPNDLYRADRGAFFRSLRDQFGATRADISLVFAITGFLYFSLGAVSGRLADRVGPRRVVAVGMVLIAAGLLLVSWALVHGLVTLARDGALQATADTTADRGPELARGLVGVYVDALTGPGGP